MKSRLLGLAVVCAIAFAPPLWATTAVLATAAPDGAQAPGLEAAAAVRAALDAAGEDVLELEPTRRRLDVLVIGRGHTFDSLQLRAQKAEEAFTEGDEQRSLQILESVGRDLRSDPDFSVQKQRLLEEVHLRLAQRLIGLAGPAEDGTATTASGKRARDVLVDVVRVNPGLVLSQDQYPPKMHRLLELARQKEQQGARGSLQVSSVPAGATVYLEGRAVGKTPLLLDKTLPAGRFRMWIEHENVRSGTRGVNIRPVPEPVEIDLRFEGVLWFAGVGVWASETWPLEKPVLARLATNLKVDRLVVVGHGDAGPFATAYEARSQAVIVRGAGDATTLAKAVRGEGAVGQEGVPPWFLASAAPRAASTEPATASATTGTPVAAVLNPEPVAAASERTEPAPDEDGGLGGVLLWTGVSVGAVALVVAAAAGTAALVYVNRTIEPQAVVRIEKTDGDVIQ